MLTEMRPFRKRDGNGLVFANSRWEMLLKAVGQPLGSANRIQESCWEMPRGYWKISEQFLKGIGKLLGNAPIPAVSQWERRWNWPAAIGKNVANFHPISLKCCVSVNI
jgi:hypothetical protein